MCAHCHVKPRFKEPTGKVSPDIDFQWRLSYRMYGNQILIDSRTKRSEVHPYCGKGCGAKAKAAGGSAPGKPRYHCLSYGAPIQNVVCRPLDIHFRTVSAASYGAPQSTVNGGPPRPGYQQAPAGGGFRATAAAGVGAPPPHSAYTPYNFGAGMGGMQQPQYGMGGVGGMQQPFGMQQPQHAMGGMQPFGMGGVQQPQQPVPVGPVSPMQPAQASSLQGPAASGGGYPAGS